MYIGVYMRAYVGVFHVCVSVCDSQGSPIPHSY